MEAHPTIISNNKTPLNVFWKNNNDYCSSFALNKSSKEARKWKKD